MGHSQCREDRHMRRQRTISVVPSETTRYQCADQKGMGMMNPMMMVSAALDCCYGHVFRLGSA
jgi:hypothetical protein